MQKLCYALVADNSLKSLYLAFLPQQISTMVEKQLQLQGSHVTIVFLGQIHPVSLLTLEDCATEEKLSETI